MITSDSIQKHMEVVGSDGGHVGRVDHVKGDVLELAKLDLGAGFKHHTIPVSWVERIEEDKVFLSISHEDAKARWTEASH